MTCTHDDVVILCRRDKKEIAQFKATKYKQVIRYENNCYNIIWILQYKLMF